MRSLRIVAAVAALVMIVSATSAFAFDGTRKGFILGFGLGGGYVSQDVIKYYAVPRVETDTGAGFATDFRIGGGFTEQFLLYYENRVSWTFVETVDIDMVNPNTFSLFGVGLLGASYYFQTEAPAWYVLGSVGTANRWIEEQNTNGFGLSGGAGYEFTKHWAVEATVNWGQTEKDDFTLDAYSILVTISGLAY